jgi:hypothetical protein
MAISFVVDRANFQNLLGQFFLYDGSPAFESIVVEAEPKSFSVKNSTLNVAGVYTVVAPRFFKEYDVKEPTDFVITSSFFQKLGRFFSHSETIEVTVSDKTIKAVGNNEEYTENLLNPDKVPFFTEVARFTLGSEKVLLPKNALEKAGVIALVNLADIASIPASERFKISGVGDKIKIDIEDVGQYSRIIEPKENGMPKENGKVTPFKSITTTFNVEYFGRLVKNILTDDVWLIMNEGALLFAKNTPEVASLLLMVADEES